MVPPEGGKDPGGATTLREKGETPETGNHDTIAGLAVAPFHRSEMGVSALGSHGPETDPSDEGAREMSRRVITTSNIARSPAEGASAFPPRETFPDNFSFDNSTSYLVLSDSTTRPVCLKLSVIQRGRDSALDAPPRREGTQKGAHEIFRFGDGTSRATKAGAERWNDRKLPGPGPASSLEVDPSLLAEASASAVWISTSPRRASGTDTKTSGASTCTLLPTPSVETMYDGPEDDAAATSRTWVAAPTAGATSIASAENVSPGRATNTSPAGSPAVARAGRTSE
mmetsp:Transcript_38744/g.91630  ORF Transcript_38744/g.91630 Transcript_38744/m.91630 type:complete len:284 (-) Transcript_38744:1434-2285(-)